MDPLVRLGYWVNDQQPGLPRPEDFVDEAWDEDEREDVALYLGWGTVVRSYLGRSECRLCGQQNGSLEFTDGTYIWPEGLRHYIDVHGVRLPDEVVAHIRRHTEELEAAPVDDDWWRSLGVP